MLLVGKDNFCYWYCHLRSIFVAAAYFGLFTYFQNILAYFRYFCFDTNRFWFFGFMWAAAKKSYFINEVGWLAQWGLQNINVLINTSYLKHLIIILGLFNGVVLINFISISQMYSLQACSQFFICKISKQLCLTVKVF